MLRKLRKYKNIVYPTIIGVIAVVIWVLAGFPLVQAAFPLPILIVTGYNLHKYKPIFKLFLDGFLVAGIALLAILALGFLAKENEFFLKILTFPYYPQ